MLTPLSPNVLVYSATPTPTAVELYRLLNAAGDEVTFTPFTMTVDELGDFTGTFDGDCVPLLSDGETWSLLWKTTLAGYADPIYDRQTLLVGFGDTPHSYGTLAGVQGFVYFVVFGTTSKPTATEVAAMLVEQSAIIDARLAGGGYTVPVTDAAAASLLGSIAVRFVAASIVERVVMGKSSDAAKVESAATWRREAESLLAGIVNRATPLMGVVHSGTGAGISGSAGISSDSETAWPSANRAAFVRAHGSENANVTGATGVGYTDDSDA